MWYVVVYVVYLPTKFHMHSCNDSIGITVKPKPGENVRKALVISLYIAFVTPIVLLLILGN